MVTDRSILTRSEHIFARQYYCIGEIILRDNNSLACSWIPNGWKGGNNYGGDILIGKNFWKEIRFSDTKFKILGGSRTDFNQVDDFAFLEKGIELARAGVQQGKVGVASQLIDAMTNSMKLHYTGINDKNAVTLAKALTNNKMGVKVLNRIANAQKSKKQKFKHGKF